MHAIASMYDAACMSMNTQLEWDFAAADMLAFLAAAAITGQRCLLQIIPHSQPVVFVIQHTVHKWQ